MPMDVYQLKSKPVVFYRTDLPYYIKLGESAFVHPVNHPDKENVSNTKHVRTSEVIAFTPLEGGFETLNTLYRPYKGA
jgi:hypothetical protein